MTIEEIMNSIDAFISDFKKVYPGMQTRKEIDEEENSCAIYHNIQDCMSGLFTETYWELMNKYCYPNGIVFVSMFFDDRFTFEYTYSQTENMDIGILRASSKVLHNTLEYQLGLPDTQTKPVDFMLYSLRAHKPVKTYAYNDIDITSAMNLGDTSAFRGVA